MSDRTLALLREIRGVLSKHSEQLTRIEVRLTGIEQTTGAILSMCGAQNERLDGLESGMGRVKRRLELIDD